MTFTNKEIYLEALAEWKFDYMKAAADCRKTRQELKDANRAYSKEMTYTNLSALNKARRERAGAKYHATHLIDQLHQMKKEAERQYLERKEQA